jgi:surfeit locus 1 family protein
VAPWCTICNFDLAFATYEPSLWIDRAVFLPLTFVICVGLCARRRGSSSPSRLLIEPNKAASEATIDKAMERRRLLTAGFTAALAIGLLCALGIWQLQRLAVKTALLNRIDTRIHAPAVPLPDETEWPRLQAGDYEYRHVTLSGSYDHDKEALVFRPSAGVIGYLVLTPLKMASGAVVIINRGFVPSDKKEPASRILGQTPGTVRLTGLMRPPEARNFFTPADSPAQGIWFSRDPLAMAQAKGLSRSAPFSVDLDATPIPGGLPRGGATIVAIPNNHLEYALTWFGLAAILAAFVAAAYRERQQA